MRKIIFYLFAVLIFFVPIVLWPFTSEVFEFNKIVLVYILTTLIVAAWLTRIILVKRFIFRRTILDIPFLIFFGSQLVSTMLSIDFYTSVFGYYSRFNGGLLSTICYLLLYWAFVSNFDGKDALKLIKIWFSSAVLVSIYGVLEHFGVDKNVWVQDVQSRVFSTLGQPNWLAAWVVALTPIAWVGAIYNLQFTIYNKFSKSKFINFLIYFGLSILFFWTLIFTKSRSGFLGFGAAFLIFWCFYFWTNRKNLKSSLIIFTVISSSLLIINLISGTQFTPSLKSLMTQFNCDISHLRCAINKSANLQMTNKPLGTALETGGTESGTIRKIVWQGAAQVWLHYPIFGTGVETFAYSYYLYRPVAHNLTSEWDFIYNKAHNEFLNFAANSGTFGLFSYLAIIGFSVYLFLKNRGGDNNLNYALLAGFVSLSVSNFFGFSVVPTQLQFFLFPAIASALAVQRESITSWAEYEVHRKTIDNQQKIFIFLVLCTISYVLFAVGKYWYADILYARAKSLNSVPRPDLALPVLSDAIKLQPSQSIYYGELANSYTAIAMAYDQAEDASSTAQFTNYAISSIQKSVNTAPANVNLRRTMFGVYIRLSTIDEKYLASARDSILETIRLAPTDAKLYYNLGITDANLKNFLAADLDLKKAIELKPNYTDARIEYAALLVHLGKNSEAKEQLNYILAKLDPGNSTAKQALENLK